MAQKGNGRLAMLSSYLTRMFQQMRGMVMPGGQPAAQSRSDAPPTSWLSNPFSKLKSRRFTNKDQFAEKKYTIKMSKKSKSRKSDHSEKSGGLFKLPKFGKDKRKAQQSMEQAGQAVFPHQQFVAPMMPDYMPMYVEETMHMPQIVKAPASFYPAPNFQNVPKNAKPTHLRQNYGQLHVADTQPKPVVLSPPAFMNQPNSQPNRNHFNNNNNNNNANAANLRPAASTLHNTLNDYQVSASSPFLFNSFQEQPSRQVAPQSFAQPNSPVLVSNFFYQSPHTRPSGESQAASSAAAKPQPQIPAQPPLASLPDPFRTYSRHSYGLPSVGIRYTYDQKPSTLAPVRVAATTRRPLPPTAAPVRIEATRYNFPNPLGSGPNEETADLQLEHFLRDQFIGSVRPQAGLPQQQFRPPAPQQVPAQQHTTRRPAVHIPRVQTTPPVTINVPAQPHLATVSSSSRTTPKPGNAFASFSSSLANPDPFAKEREKFFNSFSNHENLSSGGSTQGRRVPQSSPKQNPLLKPQIDYKLTPISESVFEIRNNRTRLQGQSFVSPNKPAANSFTHRPSRFELTRSTLRPSVQYESYEWTTPASLKDDKIQVHFNVMSPTELEDEFNRKKYLFPGQNAEKALGGAAAVAEQRARILPRHRRRLQQLRAPRPAPVCLRLVHDL